MSPCGVCQHLTGRVPVPGGCPRRADPWEAPGTLPAAGRVPSESPSWTTRAALEILSIVLPQGLTVAVTTCSPSSVPALLCHSAPRTCSCSELGGDRAKVGWTAPGSADRARVRRSVKGDKLCRLLPLAGGDMLQAGALPEPEAPPSRMKRPSSLLSPEGAGG